MESLGDPQPPAWTVDPTVRFDRIHVVESLPEPGFASKTGRILFGRLESMCVGTPVLPFLHVIESRSDLFQILQRALGEAENGNYPLLHFETHGASRAPGLSTVSLGLVMASGELVKWSELAPILTAINEATRLRLLVFAAACYGLDGARLVQPLDPAPFRVLVGPLRATSIHEVDQATAMFYGELFRTSDGAAAARSLAGGNTGFWTLTAEWLFLQTMLGYFNEMTTDSSLAARVEGIVAPMLLRGTMPAELPARRAWVRRALEDREALFERTYRRFFFVDKYPEIAERFALSYAGCFESAAS